MHRRIEVKPLGTESPHPKFLLSDYRLSDSATRLLINLITGTFHRFQWALAHKELSNRTKLDSEYQQPNMITYP